jgi:hypothetical protein
LNANLGHQNADGTWSPGGEQLTPGDKVNIGEAKEEVLRRLGRPNGPPPSQHALDQAKEGDSIGAWAVSPRDTLVVTFRENVVSSFWHEGPDESASSTPSKAETIAGKVAEIGASLYYTSVCPGIYRKPALFMTAADVQILQGCNANGFMLFGVYLYTGGK